MSKIKHDKSKTSTELQNLYNEVCFRLGQEIRNEERAQENQTVLRERQKELEQAFNASMQREQEAAAAKARNEASKKAFEDKAKANGTETQATDAENTTEA